MEHLKPLFHADLADPESPFVRVEGGALIVGPASLNIAEILRTVGEGTYNRTFATWAAGHRQRRLERAEELLTEYDQRGRFENLKQAFRGGMVTPFVGAGMSIPSEYPGWTTFLRELRVQTSVTEEQLDEQLAEGRYDEAAQALADDLGVRFDERVEAAFGWDRELRGPVQLVPYIFDTPVATTNFDSVLPRCYVGRGRPFEQTLVGIEADEIQRVMSSGRRVLVKLHGNATSGRGRVLTTREYDNAYQGDTLPRVVRALSRRTLLFMGCGLTIDRLLRAIRDVVADEGHSHAPRHYALLGAGNHAERRVREIELAQLNVYPIWYPKRTDDESIEAFLYRLADGLVTL